jgi:predicted nucleic acid-binding protein
LNFILDSSLTMAFVFADEATHDTDKLLDSLGKGAKAFTAPLWRWEVGNALLMAERRKRITSAESQRHLTALQVLPVELDDGASREAWHAAILLARKHHLTLYDASYLELAMRHGLPLGSLDIELRKAAKSEGVKFLPEAA